MIDLDDMEARIETLERRLGSGGSGSGRAGLVGSVVGVKERLRESVAGREKAEAVLGRTEELSGWLSPAVAEAWSADAASQWRSIQASLPSVERRLDQLDAIQASQSALDSEHIRNAPNLRPKLDHIAAQTALIRDELHQQTEDVSELVREYNAAMSAVFKQFAYWDYMIAKKEPAPE